MKTESKMKRPTISITRRAKRRIRPVTSLICFGVLFPILIAAVFYSASSASTWNIVSRGAGEQPPVSASKTAGGALTSGDLGSFASKAFLRTLMLQDPPPPESIDTYGATGGICSDTPKDSFSLGEEVCARVAGAPLRPAAPLRRISFSGTNGSVADTAEIVADPQTLVLTLPTTATSLIDGEVVDNRGTWSASINSTADYGVRAIAYFSVSDPAAAAADLVIYANSTSVDTLEPGQATGFSVWLNNIGPDAGENVHVTQSLPPFMTFVSSTPGSGAAFNCSESAGVVDCVPTASLAKGAISTFTLNYTVSAAAPSTIVTTQIDITSATLDPRPASNSAGIKVEIRSPGGPPATCSIACPGTVTVSADTTNQDGDPGAIVNFAGGIESSGDCGTIQTSQASGSFFPVGSTTVNVSSSTGGGSCSFVVTVLDTAPPTITCPTNIGVEAPEGACDATVNVGTPTSTGNGVTVTATRSDGQTLGSPYPAGTTTITWTATDSNDRTASCTQTVTVTLQDTTDPTIIAPPDVTLTTPADTSGSCGVVVGEGVLGSPTTDDNCSASVNVSRTGVPPGNFFPVGTTTINYTATDSAGNTATSAQQVIVTDGTPPQIAAPPDASYTCPSEVPAANPSQATSGVVLDDNGNPVPPGPPSDSCGTPVVTVNETTSGDGSASSPLIITRVFTATDAAGNTASSTQTITVIDGTPPTISAPDDATYQCASEVPAGNASQATSSDNCAAPAVTFSETSTGSGTTASPLIITRTYTATDAAGNSASDSQTITVIDTTAPTITAPADVTAFTGPGAVSCDAAVSNAMLGTASANDNCSAVTVTRSPSGNTFPLGTTNVIWTATDAAGNQATATQQVTVNDNTPPVVTPPANITVSLPLNSSATSMAVTYPNPATATDNCAGAITFNYSPASGSTFPVGTTTVTVTATDAHSNSATATFTVTVLYDFTGFFSPVGNLPVLNSVNAGRAIPVKFSLSGNKGLDIFAVNNPYTVSLNCDTSDPGVDVTETLTAGGSTLSYSPDQYTYVWKTEGSWAGTCRQLVITLNDGSERRANFKFR